MKNSYLELVMNPIRLRIIQYLMKNTTGTTAEIKTELSDIPTTTLYRNIKMLLEGGCIEIIDQKQLRGTIEKTYGLVKEPMGKMTTEKESQMIQAGLLSLLQSFQQYFSNPRIANAKEDRLLFTTSTFFLSDMEFDHMGEEIQSIIDRYLTYRPDLERKQRRLSIVSSPCEKEGANNEESR